jgi:hypothetical protein
MRTTPDTRFGPLAKLLRFDFSSTHAAMRLGDYLYLESSPEYTLNGANFPVHWIFKATSMPPIDNDDNEYGGMATPVGSILNLGAFTTEIGVNAIDRKMYYSNREILGMLYQVQKADLFINDTDVLNYYDLISSYSGGTWFMSGSPGLASQYFNKDFSDYYNLEGSDLGAKPLVYNQIYTMMAQIIANAYVLIGDSETTAMPTSVFTGWERAYDFLRDLANIWPSAFAAPIPVIAREVINWLITRWAAKTATDPSTLSVTEFRSGLLSKVPVTLRNGVTLQYRASPLDPSRDYYLDFDSVEIADWAVLSPGEWSTFK